jgi:DNA-binding NarL/FixJ family response regulator
MADYLLRDCDPNLDIETITSPNKAIEMVINSGYDCVVTDYRMPKINGIELTERIRKHSNIPIIMFTGWGDESIAAAGYEAGLDGYMRKDSGIETYCELARRIRRVAINR